MQRPAMVGGAKTVLAARRTQGVGAVGFAPYGNQIKQAVMSGQQIKPCPFCGRRGKLEEDTVMSLRGHRRWAVGCGVSFSEIEYCYGQITVDGDDAFSISFQSPEKAIEQWNKRPTPTPKFKVGDVVVVTAAMPNFKMTIEHIIERDGKFRYAHRDIYRHENDLELFDPGKKYPFTA